MKILFILDPYEKLYPKWDNSLAMLRVMSLDGHSCWLSAPEDLYAVHGGVRARAAELSPKSNIILPGKRGVDYSFHFSSSREFPLRSFDLVFLRVEPPFDLRYYQLTLLLDLETEYVPMINHPAGIRSTSEKLGTLYFPNHIPRSVVSCSPDVIAAFQKKIGAPLVVKPLNNKGGRGVRLLSDTKQLPPLTRNGKRWLIAQQRIRTGVDKRIVVIHGEIMAAYEKHPPKDEFRANIGLGSDFYPTRILASERRLVKSMKPYLKTHGLVWVGLDVMGGKLIDFNVTCPAGLTEACSLEPKAGILEQAAKDLLRGVRLFVGRR